MELLKNEIANAREEIIAGKKICSDNDVKHALNDGMYVAFVLLAIMGGAVASLMKLCGGVLVPLYMGLIAFMLIKRLSNMFHKWSNVMAGSLSDKTFAQKVVLFETTTGHIILRNVILFGVFFTLGAVMLTMLPVASRTNVAYTIIMEFIIGTFLAAETKL